MAYIWRKTQQAVGTDLVDQNLLSIRDTFKKLPTDLDVLTKAEQYPINKAVVDALDGYALTTGITDGSNAAAGHVGEYLEAIVAPGSISGISSATPFAIGSIDLTAGDWDVWGTVFLNTASSSVNITVQIGKISSTSASIGTFGDRSRSDALGNISVSTTAFQSLDVPMHQRNIATTTTHYLNAQITAGGSTTNLRAGGHIKARRVR